MPDTYFIWDELSDNVRMEVDENGAVSAEYMNELGQFGSLVLVFLPNQVGENRIPAIA